MILLPQVINSDLTDQQIKYYCKAISAHINVVVIVPSDYRANFWTDCADLILNKDSLYDGVERLKTGKVGLVVLINRYDGIDLPKDACRLLVVDDLPDVRRLTDKINQSILMGSERVVNQIVQRIEQGMGRGVRSSDDYCVVFLMGKRLTSQIFSGNSREKFSAATRKQLELSDQLSDQMKNNSLEEIWTVALNCLERNQGWVTASKGALAMLTYDDKKNIDKTIISQRKAYDAAIYGNFPKATSVLLESINVTQDRYLKSYLKFCLAEYLNLYDESESQKTLMSAASENPRLIKPISGIAYHKLEDKVMDQARRCSEYLLSHHSSANEVIIKIDSILEDLIFKPDTSDPFEEAIKVVARYIGFDSQRPEAECNRGPDDLWIAGSLTYFVIECKNGVTSKSEKINKENCNQLNGSINWFFEEYDRTCKCVPIMVHPTHVFDYAASPHPDIRIMNKNKLDQFKTNVREFLKSICVANSISSVDEIRRRLTFYKLRADDFISEYTVVFTK